MFREKMFNKTTLKDLASHLESRLNAPFKKLVNKQIDSNGWMKKLIEFYQDEVGSDDEDSNSDSGSDSDASDSSSAASGSSVGSVKVDEDGTIITKSSKKLMANGMSSSSSSSRSKSASSSKRDSIGNVM